MSGFSRNTLRETIESLFPSYKPNHAQLTTFLLRFELEAIAPQQGESVESRKNKLLGYHPEFCIGVR